MSNYSDEFVALGMARYKQAAATLVAFGKEVEVQLQQILEKRNPEKLGGFIPKAAKAPRSTKYWSAYPLLNAKLDGEFLGESVTITIMVNWYEAEGEYPVYELDLEPWKPYVDAMKEFDWQNNVSFISEKKIQLMPNESDFNLAQDFDILLDEISRFFNSLQI
jgi:hypothetical protein